VCVYVCTNIYKYNTNIYTNIHIYITSHNIRKVYSLNTLYLYLNNLYLYLNTLYLYLNTLYLYLNTLYLYLNTLYLCV